MKELYLLIRSLVPFVAIREDRTRGGRSTYACSYALPPTSAGSAHLDLSHHHQSTPPTWEIPNLLKEIVECESLWHLSAEVDPLGSLGKTSSTHHGGNPKNADYLAELCSAADRRLYRLVKWCKSLPLFKHIQVCHHRSEATERLFDASMTLIPC
jgi:hypothetical protein